MVNLRAQISDKAPESAAKQPIHHMADAPGRVHVPEAKLARSGIAILAFGAVVAAFWAGTASAYMWGYFGAQGIGRLDPQIMSFVAVVTFLPPLLVIAMTFALARAQTLSEAARYLAGVSDRLTSADENAVQSAQRLGRAVRRELDALSSGLDGAFGRMRALETALQDRIAQLEDAGARAAVRAETIAQRLHAEREGIEELATRIDDTSARAAETLAGRSAQLKAMIEDASARAAETLAGRSAQLKAMIDAAGNELKAAGQTLDAQVAQFREAAEKAVASPQAVGVELDRQSKQIETAGEAAAARAEFVLARQERQRVAMNELLTRLKQEADAYQAMLESQRQAAERAAAFLTGQAQHIGEVTAEGVRRVDTAMTEAAARSAQLTSGFVHDAETVTAEGVRRIDTAMTEAAARSAQVTSGFVRDAETMATEGVRRIDNAIAEATARSAQLASGLVRDAETVKQTSDTVAGGIAQLAAALREAATSAQALVADSTAEAKRRSLDYVGEAMGQCDQLLRAASSVAEEAEKARAALARAAEEAERHIVKIPGIAAQEAQRVRETVRAETEQMLDMSARAISTLQGRKGRRAAEEPAQGQASDPAAVESQSEGLLGLARRITHPKRRLEDRSENRGSERSKSYQLSDVLAAAEAGGKATAKPGIASTLAPLQAALAEIAGDLDPLVGDTSDPGLWRRYLDGDKGVFARRLASSIGPESVDRISGLYRDNLRFHEAADAYISEFESMLARARESDRDGFLASTLLTADTGKIYLAVAYALGRLE